jgi:HPr kinase/phosphorylase
MGTDLQPRVRRPKVTVQDVLDRGHDRLRLRVFAAAGSLGRVVREPALHRPGLELAGFFKHFAQHRIQVIGLAEYDYLEALPARRRAERLANVFAHRVPALVFARGKPPFHEVSALAERYGVPVLVTPLITRQFQNAATVLLEDLAAPRCRVCGTLLEVAGLGVLLEGTAGIGKSETALGLIKRGHALIADDMTEVRLTGSGTLVGTAVALTRHYMEIRGIGIIHVPSLFGAASVISEKAVDLVVTLRPQADADAEADRIGEARQHPGILGIRLPQIVIPVAPGRDLVNIVETAALEWRLRQAGQVAARDLDERIKRRLAGASGE